VLDHVLDASLELSNHEDDKVDEENLPNDRDVEEWNEGQKEGDYQHPREVVPESMHEKSWTVSGETCHGGIVS
jgi:hypothetical protein